MKHSDYLIAASAYAADCHDSTNHKYDGFRYGVHLNIVDMVAREFIDYFNEAYHDQILAACWCHDVIEDCRQTYNDVKEAIGELAANIVYAVTTEKGKNRKERANEKYYSEMKKVPFAVFVKLCDRIANVKYSKGHQSEMLKVYKKEHEAFKTLLFDKMYKEMFDELDYLLI